MSSPSIIRNGKSYYQRHKAVILEKQKKRRELNKLLGKKRTKKYKVVKRRAKASLEYLLGDKEFYLPFRNKTEEEKRTMMGVTDDNIPL